MNVCSSEKGKRARHCRRRTGSGSDVALPVPRLHFAYKYAGDDAWDALLASANAGGENVHRNEAWGTGGHGYGSSLTQARRPASKRLAGAGVTAGCCAGAEGPEDLGGDCRACCSCGFNFPILLQEALKHYAELEEALPSLGARGGSVGRAPRAPGDSGSCRAGASGQAYLQSWDAASQRLSLQASGTMRSSDL